MTRRERGEDSTWAGTEIGANAYLVPAAPPQRVEIGGAPVSEQSHEYVIRKPRIDPSADGVEAQKRPGTSLEGSLG
jgi:hypothetical protein